MKVLLNLSLILCERLRTSTENLLGAGAGAIGGAISGGNAGKGAAIGAGIGGLLGGLRSNSQKNKNKKAQQDWQRQQAGQYQQARNNYNRAYSACMSARDYTIS